MCLGFIERDTETKGERERETEIYREGKAEEEHVSARDTNLLFMHRVSNNPFGSQSDFGHKSPGPSFL